MASVAGDRANLLSCHSLQSRQEPPRQYEKKSLGSIFRSTASVHRVEALVFFRAREHFRFVAAKKRRGIALSMLELYMADLMGERESLTN